jgi:uncharacterized membrane protein YtjA (UPF0391 family)
MDVGRGLQVCGTPRTPRQGDTTMLGWALTFLVIAIIAALFGFGNIAAGAATIAQVLFVIFLILFFVALIAGMMGGGRSRRIP